MTVTVTGATQAATEHVSLGYTELLVYSLSWGLSWATTVQASTAATRTLKPNMVIAVKLVELVMR